jgi:hypothetical protein
MTDTGKCPAFGYDCEYVAKVEAQAAEIEALKRALWKIEFEVQQAFALDEPLTGQAGSEA